jgi:hypothetical protein
LLRSGPILFGGAASPPEVNMDLVSLAKVAMDLGVIPAFALFLIVSMHRQNKRLTDMVDRREQNNIEMLKLLVGEIAKYRERHSGGGTHVTAD